jgi:hypothetical protein
LGGWRKGRALVGLEVQRLADQLLNREKRETKSSNSITSKDTPQIMRVPRKCVLLLKFFPGRISDLAHHLFDFDREFLPPKSKKSLPMQ